MSSDLRQATGTVITTPNRCWSNTAFKPMYEDGLIARSAGTYKNKNPYSACSPDRVVRDSAAAWACGWNAGSHVPLVAKHFFARFDEGSSSWVTEPPPHDLTGRKYACIW